MLFHDFANAVGDYDNETFTPCKLLKAIENKHTDLFEQKATEATEKDAIHGSVISASSC